MIAAISSVQAVASVARSLHLDGRIGSGALSDELLAQAIRRAVQVLAPCPRHILIRTVVHSIVGLGLTDIDLTDRVDEAVETLVVFGDILEMRLPSNDGWGLSAVHLLRPAPPSFVVRNNGTITVLGVAGDVARRPQRYGIDIWCLVELANGIPARFLDLASPGDRYRPCDVAWRIQAAMDARSSRPQQFRTHTIDDKAKLSFFAPLPSWAERRLSIVGTKAKGDRCLFSYEIPGSELAIECNFLRESLWMADTSETHSRGKP